VPTLAGHPDAMSDVLSLVRMRGEVLCANDYGAPWAFSFEPERAHFHIIEGGPGWLAGEHASAPIQLQAGDLVFLPHASMHVLSSEPGLQPTPIMEALGGAPTRGGHAHRLGGDGAVTNVLSGRLSFEGALAPKLLRVLPTLIHIRAERAQVSEWLAQIAAYLRAEMSMSKAGWSITIARLIDLLLIHALRDWGAESPTNLGWLSGLVDPVIGRALSAIHEQPGRPWTVEQLASVAGLSRSAFAARFTQLVGQTPQRYLAMWRLDLAADHLRGGGAKIGEIAAMVGYGSEAALTRAFKAQFGVTPGAYRRVAAPS
jgi:AraC-like DNA-binding protein